MTKGNGRDDSRPLAYTHGVYASWPRAALCLIPLADPVSDPWASTTANRLVLVLCSAHVENASSTHGMVAERCKIMLSTRRWQDVFRRVFWFSSGPADYRQTHGIFRFADAGLRHGVLFPVVRWWLMGAAWNPGVA